MIYTLTRLRSQGTLRAYGELLQIKKLDHQVSLISK